MIDLNVDFASPVPVYDQIKKIIKYAVAKKALVEDESLPSIRELASFLKINPNTVARAYRDLTQEKVIDGRAGKGFWVAKIKSENAAEDKIGLLKEEFLKFMEKAVSMGFAPDVIKNMMDDFFTLQKEEQ